MTDVLWLGVVILVVIDPIAACIGAADLARDRPGSDRVAIVVGGALVAFVVLAASAVLADPVLDALHISAPAAQLAAGIVVLVPALDLLWQGPAVRVRSRPDASAWQQAVYPYAIPLVAGPAAVAAVVAWSAAEGAGVTVGASAGAAGATALVAWLWRRPPTGRGARVLGGFSAVAMSLVAFDLIRDGIFAT